MCLTPRCVSLRRVWLRAVLVCSESLILRIPPQNHFSLFIRGPSGLDSEGKICHFKGSVSPILAPDKQAKVFFNYVSISPRYSIAKLEKLKILCLANQKFVLQIFSFMIDVFTSKRISPDCLFKGNHRQVKISNLIPRCVAHRRDNFLIEYLDEIETDFEITLACISGAQMGLNWIMKKTGGRKSRDTLPL